MRLQNRKNIIPLISRLVISIIFFAALFSCSALYQHPPASWNIGFKPRPLTGMGNFPETDTEYGKGFKDGCNSALEAVGKGLITDVNETRYDYKRMLKSPDYNTGWWDGIEQCTYIMDWDVL